MPWHPSASAVTGNGRPVFASADPVESKTFETKARAEAWARQAESEMDRGAFVSRAEAESAMPSEALRRYESEVTATKRGHRSEHCALRSWSRDSINACSLAQIRSQDLATIRDRWVKHDFKAGTIVRRFAILSRVSTVARREWGMGLLENPVRDVRMPRVDHARDRRLQGNEQARLLAAAADSAGNIGPLIIWAIETGMRRGEIAGMRWAHVDSKGRVLLIPITKTGNPPDTTVREDLGCPG